MTSSPVSKLIEETLALAKEREEAIEACLSGTGRPTYRANTDEVVERSGKLAEMLQVACEALRKTQPMVRGCSNKGDHDDPTWCDEGCGDYGKTIRKALAQIDAIAAGEGKEE